MNKFNMNADKMRWNTLLTQSLLLVCTLMLYLATISILLLKLNPVLYIEYCSFVTTSPSTLFSWQYTCSHLALPRSRTWTCNTSISSNKYTPKLILNKLSSDISQDLIRMACVCLRQTQEVRPLLFGDGGGWHYGGVREVKRCRRREKGSGTFVL